MNSKYYSLITLTSLALTVGTYAQEPTLEKQGEKIAAEVKQAGQAQQSEEIEVCFVLDTTGSMSGLIQGAQSKIWEIANEIAKRDSKPIIRFSLVGYRDRGDAYVTKMAQMTDDLDAIHGELFKFKAAGGGDTPESVNQALNEAISKVKWSDDKKVKKVVFLVGDAPPHMDYEQDISYKTTCKLAKEKGIIINTIQCGSIASCTPIWRDIAARGMGEYVALPQNGGAIIIETPQDKKIAELSIKIYDSGIPYGDSKKRKFAAEKQYFSRDQAGKNASSNAYKNSCQNSFRGGSSVRAWGGNDDLITEWGDKRITLKNLNRKHLPENLREKSDKDLVIEINKRIKLREETQKEIDKLQLKRTEYLKTEKAKLKKSDLENSFDERVEKLLKKQLK